MSDGFNTGANVYIAYRVDGFYLEFEVNARLTFMLLLTTYSVLHKLNGIE